MLDQTVFGLRVIGRSADVGRKIEEWMKAMRCNLQTAHGAKRRG
jgi:hypothetical protein